MTGQIINSSSGSHESNEFCGEVSSQATFRGREITREKDTNSRQFLRTAGFIRFDSDSEQEEDQQETSERRTFLLGSKEEVFGASLSEEPTVSPGAGATTEMERRRPPLSLCDTMASGSSAHGEGTLFKDEEILQVHEPVSEVTIGTDGDTLQVGKTEKGKYVIQQQATRGCTAAVAAMLIMDNGKEPDLLQLRRRNLGNSDCIMGDITKVELTPVKEERMDLKTLQTLIETRGPAIVTIGGDLGAHVIVVDEVTSDQVRLRDPYHGWDITVTLDAFKERFDGVSAIQVKPAIAT